LANLKIGAFLASFRLGLEGGIRRAAEVGLTGLEISSVRKPDTRELELDVEKMDDAVIARLKELLAGHGLEATSVCGDIGGFAHQDEKKLRDIIVRTRRIMDATKALGATIVQTHIGFVPPDPASPIRRTMKDAIEEVGAYGDQIGILLASETGPESGEDLRDFLDELRTGSIKVNYDPANLVMKNFDPISGVVALKDYIAHTHAKDGKRGNGEVPLGEGDVDFPRYVRTLQSTGYNGYYVIEREVGANPAEDIAKAKRYLDTLA
jgi:L-ribulose-5-phosphate 3-epimerase